MTFFHFGTPDSRQCKLVLERDIAISQALGMLLLTVSSWVLDFLIAPLPTPS